MHADLKMFLEMHLKTPNLGSVPTWQMVVIKYPVQGNNSPNDSLAYHQSVSSAEQQLSTTARKPKTWSMEGPMCVLGFKKAFPHEQ